MRREKLTDYLRLDSQIRKDEGNRAISRPAYKGILYEKYKDDFGNDILHKIGENTVVLGGAIHSLETLTGITANWKPATLNEIYNINPSISGDNMASHIALFGVGTGGCGLEFGSIVETDIKSRDVPNLIPLRVTESLTGSDADKYYFSKANADGTTSYYLKEFASTPIIKSCWKDSLDEEQDGTEIVEEVYNSQRTEGIQTFAEFVLDLNTKDVREYFESIGSLDSARYNSIGLFTGDKVEISEGVYDYVNVRLFSYLNIDNRSVKIRVASEYIYRVLALV